MQASARRGGRASGGGGGPGSTTTNKIDLNAAFRAGVTPLMRAARHGADWSGLRQLVAAGTDLAARDARGRTALDLALQSGRSDATRYLLSVNAPYTDPEQVDTTP